VRCSSGKDKEAEARLTQAAQTIETVAAKLATPSLRERFLGAEPVVAVYAALGRRPPSATGRGFTNLA
jgi:hypothetical protein